MINVVAGQMAKLKPFAYRRYKKFIKILDNNTSAQNYAEGYNRVGIVRIARIYFGVENG